MAMSVTILVILVLIGIGELVEVISIIVRVLAVVIVSNHCFSGSNNINKSDILIGIIG